MPSSDRRRGGRRVGPALRTLAAGALLTAATPAAGWAAAAPTPTRDGDLRVFPVLGGATYVDDFGDPRGARRHEGNDLMAARRTPVLAVADGVVKRWTSRAGGYMLYLRTSRREYLYVHLNNDRTLRNDNRGGPGTAYAPGVRTGSRVRAGQLIGFVGNSGDADRTNPHLHFEEHRVDGRAMDPYADLLAAPVAVFPTRPTAAPTPVALTFVGTLGRVTPSAVTLRVEQLLVNGRAAPRPRRIVAVRLDPRLAAAGAPTLVRGLRVRIDALPTLPTLPCQIVADLSWTAGSIRAEPVSPDD